MAERIAHHSGQTVDEIERDSERDLGSPPKRHQAYGLCDKVIVRRGEIR